MNGRFVGRGRCDDIFTYCGCLSRCRDVDLAECRDRKFVDINPEERKSKCLPSGDSREVLPELTAGFIVMLGGG